MLIKRLIILIFLTCALKGIAQDSLLLRDYQFAKQQDSWLTSTNAAALTRFDKQNISEAELSLTHQRGGFTNFYGSPNMLQASAGIESYFRLTKRTVLTGSISYNNLSGKEMAGSAFTILPSKSSAFNLSSVSWRESGESSLHPFDIIEDSLGNEGDKHLDVYRLSGGFGTDIYKGLSLGAGLTYTAANYAKYKDLRHQNKYMDLQLSAGIYGPVASWCSIGLNYLYHRNVESVSFSTYGTSDKVYVSLVSYANFMGHVEQFGSSGYTDKSREMPLVTNEHGGSLQFSLNFAPFTIFASGTYSHANGYYGRKSPYTITYSTHEGEQLALNTRLTYEPTNTSDFKSSRHSLDLSFRSSTLRTDANTYVEKQNESGASYYDYYSPTKLSNKLLQSASALYSLDLDINGEIPTWTFQAGMSRNKRKQTAYVHPYLRRQELKSTEWTIAFTRNLIFNKGVWSFTLGGSYLKGDGDPYEDDTFQKPSDKQMPPHTMEAYLMREYQYLTAAQYCVGGQMKYAFIFPNTRLKTHVRFALSHQKANEQFDYSTGCDRTRGLIAIGCTF